jgi:NAD-dependent DNA ligase
MARIVFTGAAIIDDIKVTRNYLVEMAEEKGHVVQDAVDYYTDVVVASSPTFKDGKGKKLQAAKKFNTKVISVNQFVEWISSRAPFPA